MAQEVNAIRIVDRDGNPNINFEQELDLAAENRPIMVVSIFGPQSSGKSTLLNRLFNTRFEEMDADQGRSQTTKGIWAAKIMSPQGCILVIDTEGSDGAERKDDNNFEKQTALFALAVSNVVIINMQCVDVGKNDAAGWPRLTTVLEVMLRNFITPRKVFLQFVLRDKTRTPEQTLKKQVKEKLHEIWKEMAKPQSKADAALENHFKVKVVALSNYEYQEEQFNNEVARLKGQIIPYSTYGEHATQRIAASDFGQYARKIWGEIREDKELDLPGYRTVIAEFRCKQIIEEKEDNFHKNQTWLQIKKDVESGMVVQDFGEKVNSLVRTCLGEYDNSLHADETVRDKRRKELIATLLRVIEPTYMRLLKEARYATLQDFKKAVDNGLKKEKGLSEVILGYTQDCLTEVDKQFADAFIEHSNWDHETKQRDKFKEDAKTYLDQEVNKRLDQLKDTNPQGRNELLVKAASVGLDLSSLVIKAFDSHFSANQSVFRAATTSTTPQPSSSASTGMRSIPRMPSANQMNSDNYLKLMSAASQILNHR